MAVQHTKNFYAPLVVLRTALPRGNARDPIVNGYTRLARGQIPAPSIITPIETGPGANDLKRVQVASGAGVLQAFVSRGAPAGSVAAHTLIGIQLDIARFFIGESGTIGGPEVRTTGAAIGGLQKDTNAEPFKLACSPTGRLRAWDDTLKLVDAGAAGVAPGTAWMYQSSDANGKDNAGVGFYTQIVACIGNDFRFANCPPNGFAVVTIGAEAPVTVNLDATGAGALDVDYRRFPLSVRYSIQDATHTEVAAFWIPQSCGGDVVGYRG